MFTQIWPSLLSYSHHSFGLVKATVKFMMRIPDMQHLCYSVHLLDAGY